VWLYESNQQLADPRVAYCFLARILLGMLFIYSVDYYLLHKMNLVALDDDYVI
jgi:hypothetical protein